MRAIKSFLVLLVIVFFSMPALAFKSAGDEIVLAQNDQKTTYNARFRTTSEYVKPASVVKPRIVIKNRAIEGRVFEVKKGNFLSKIVKEATGSATLWPKVAEDNGILAPRYVIFPGQKIIIRNEWLKPELRLVEPEKVIEAERKLAQAKRDLVEAKVDKEAVETELAQTKTELKDTQIIFGEISARYTVAKNMLADAKSEIAEVIKKVDQQRIYLIIAISFMVLFVAIALVAILILVKAYRKIDELKEENSVLNSTLQTFTM